MSLRGPMNMIWRRSVSGRWMAWALLPALLALVLAGSPAVPQTRANDLRNSSNDPLTPKRVFELRNYAHPSLMGRPSSGADQGFLRVVLPHDAFDVEQMMRVSMPAVSISWDPQRAVNGVGDLTAFDMAIFHFNSAKIGVGPLVVVPTASGNLVFRPRKNAVVPVGLGLGQVVELPTGASINIFVEPQYSVVQSGLGVPSFQAFAGVVIQLPQLPLNARRHRN